MSAASLSGPEDAGRAIVVVAAHPYPRRSRAGAALLASLDGLAAAEVRPLYDLYPDFDVDTAAEQQALARAHLVVWLHPMHWYGMPALMKHWMDTVLARGWAHGEGGTALAGKDCLWAVTTGGDEAAFSPAGRHKHAFADFVAPVEQTARYCGMNWLPPYVLHGAHLVSGEALAASGAAFRARLEAWQGAQRREPR